MNKAAGEHVWDGESLGDVHGRVDKAQRVRSMFNAIAPTYELVNTVFSGGRDRAWRKRAVKLARVQRGDAILDIACGTGDLLRTFQAGAPQASRFVGADFAHEMLSGAVANSPDALRWCEADAMALPFADGAFDVTSCAFGVRNFQNLQAGFNEMFRVLRGGGRAVILEFTRPANRLIRTVHEVYSGRIMPVAARWISRDRTGAYRYLPRSVVSFPSPEEVVERLTSAGFSSVQTVPLTFGVVAVYVATKERP